MNAMNNLLLDALKKATGALFVLDDCGATATSVDVRNGRPVILLDQAPPPELHGALRKSYPVKRGRECVRVAIVQDCRVEWTERTDRAVTVPAVAGA